MHKLVLLLIVLFTSTFEIYSQQAVTQPKLKVLIDSFFYVDQGVQQNMVTAIQKGVPFDSVKVLEAVQKETFIRHIPLLKNIYRKYGYPAPQMVGLESSHHFFVLILHSDADINFQSQMLPFIKKLVDKKQVSGKEYALLYDRIHLSKDGEQLYGTQLDYDTNGNAFPKKLKNKATVNIRRKQLDMEPLEEYLAKMTVQHKQMNRRN